MDAVIERYARQPVPRYTSYPTVPHFTVPFCDRTYAGWLADLDPARPVSLYLHVPFCRELCWYCGCNMKLANRYGAVARYVELLLGEIDLVADTIGARLPVGHVHFGGGTPTALEPDCLARVMDRVQARFDIQDGAELALESDPRTLTDAMIQTVGGLGFSRASFGIQEFNDRVQRAINRIQPADMVKRAVDGLRNAGVQGLNFDLIYGLPYQTAEGLEHTIDTCMAMAPDRIALFGYAHVPWMAKKQRLIDEAALPGPQARAEQAERAAQALLGAGMRAVGLDHFAQPHDGLAQAAAAGTLRRNFQGYTTDTAHALIGLGATSIGALPQGYVQNIVETGAWGRAVADGKLPVAKGHALAGQDVLRRRVIERLMCDGAVNPCAVGRDHGAEPGWWTDARDALVPLQDDGLVEVRDCGTVAVTARGRPLVRVAAACFDSYRARAPARHSVAL